MGGRTTFWLVSAVGLSVAGATPRGAPTGVKATDQDLSCTCEPDPSTRLPAFECHADALPEGGMLCQRGEETIYCAPPGNNPETFTGDVHCDPGFCISLDGVTCAVHCGCAEPAG